MKNTYLQTLLNKMNKKNFVFLGEAGCGKTETAINFAVDAARLPGITNDRHRKVHFFDMDQTKPLFRSRDVRTRLEKEGVIFHYEEQFEDARTLTGGPAALLPDENAVVIMDIGGDHQGSRMIGGFSLYLKRDDTVNFFVINPFRPWSSDIRAIDRTMAGVLGMARLGLENVEIMANPNNGFTTTAEEVAEGYFKTKEMIDEYSEVKSLCCMDSIADAVAEKISKADSTERVNVIPLELYMGYDWD